VSLIPRPNRTNQNLGQLCADLSKDEVQFKCDNCAATSPSISTKTFDFEETHYLVVQLSCFRNDDGVVTRVPLKFPNHGLEEPIDLFGKK
jgi:hypothetical protein